MLGVRPQTAARCLAELEGGPASFAFCLRAAAAAGTHLTHAGWEGPPAWHAIYDGLRPAQCACLSLASGARAGSITVFALVQLPFSRPSCCRPSHRPRLAVCAAAWLDTVLTIAPDPLPVAQGRCVAHGHGCGGAIDVYGDHYAVCPHTGLLAREPSHLSMRGSEAA